MVLLPVGPAATTKAATNSDGSMPAWKYGHNLGNWTILRRIYSRAHGAGDDDRLLVDPPAHPGRRTTAPGSTAPTTTPPSGTHALGTFEDLLAALLAAPGDALYLDNWTSVKDKPNENQGRELLELHTVGRGAGYTEAMVKDSAKILSGYTVDCGQDLRGVRTTPNRHTTGAVHGARVSATPTPPPTAGPSPWPT